MISQEDYSFIVALDNAADGAARERLLKDQRAQCAKTFLSLLGHVSKDQTIQYILVMLDDMIQVLKNLNKNEERLANFLSGGPQPCRYFP